MSNRHDKSRGRLLTRGSWSEAKRFAEILREETVGGVLLLVAAGLAVGWANSPWSHTYEAMSEFTIGPESLHLRLQRLGVGGGRPAGDLLLRRRTGAQARVRRR